jgi:hypothetical protein
VQCQQIAQAIAIGERLHLDLCLEQAQELYYNCLELQIGPSCLEDGNGQVSCRWLPSQLFCVLELAEKLRIDLSRWLA